MKFFLFLAGIFTVVLPARATSHTIVLKIYDHEGHGNELSASKARSIMGGLKHWDSDALVDPVDLQDIGAYPLYSRGNPARLRFDLQVRKTALAVAWPTSQGYSYVILDNDGNGFNTSATIIFNLQAAVDAKRRLDRALVSRPTYAPSSKFQAAFSQARVYLSRGEAASNDSARGKYGQLALDAINRANDAMLIEYGPAFVKGNDIDPWIGLTCDSPSTYPKWPNLASRLTKRGWVRIVFDPTVDRNHPSHHRSAVEAAQAAGLKVLGQPVDSSFANSYTRASYFARFKSYVDAYPNIEAWEVGNEVNGCWLDSLTDKRGSCTKTLLPAEDRMANKVADAANYVRHNSPNATVVLTLYWQIGTDWPQWSMFNWVRANLPATVRQNIDVVLMSVYIEDAPMGMVFDEVMNALHREFPTQRLGIGELDYWASDTSRNWWAFNQTNILTARANVASQYYAAQLGYPFANGGGFWWYFVEELPNNTRLQAAIQNVAVTAFATENQHSRHQRSRAGLSTGIKAVRASSLSFSFLLLVIEVLLIYL